MNTGIQRFKKGSIVNFQFMFPDGVKRLVFSLYRKHEPNTALLEQVINNPKGEKGLAEIAITGTATDWIGTGIFIWRIFALNSDGTRDTWFPFSDGQIEIYDWMGAGKDLEILP